MTREQLEQYVGTWLPRLRLTHWDVFFDWDTPSSKANSAEIEWSTQYDQAAFRVSAGYHTWTPRFAETTVVHELLHLVARDLQVAVDTSHALLRGPARELADARVEHELEGVVDRIAAVLVALGTT